MNQNFCVLIAGVLLAFSATSALACDVGHAEVGYISHPPVGQVSMRRDGQRIQLTVGQTACDGDVITVGAGGVLALSTPSNPDMVYGPRVPPTGQTLRASGGENLFTTAFKIALDIITPAAEQYSDQSIGRGMDAGCEFTSAALQAGRAIISPGWPSIIVHWRCGRGPFSLSLKAPDGTTVVTDSLDATTAAIPTGPMQSGLWRIDLTGPADRQLHGAFTVDANQTPPSGLSTPSAEVESAAAAISLAARSDSEFEAEQIFSHSPVQGIDRDVILQAIACKAQNDRPDMC